MTAIESLFSLKGKRALITGSSQGIGFALARGLASAGAEIILNGRNEARLEASAGKLRDEGAIARTAPFDVTDSKAVKGGIDAIEASIGAIDILVNNAGMQNRQSLEDFSDEDWHQLMQTNLDSVFFVSKHVAKHMIPRKAGKIINICSVQSKIGRPTIAAYTASKGAVAMLTKGMCIDWAQHNIQINGLAPGYFKTELTEALVNNPEFTAWLTGRTPARRWGDVEELQGACIFLASPASSFTNGHIMYVDGGVTTTL
ncbi:SDR family oxidoreductase [Pseudahrensia aquimaris]|uniref:SDR family oxidoreductase n=1 Tax=Pseudahrensia aquimaris TaxID=744461 RepID=A0ABW3FJT8_9HYPH